MRQINKYERVAGITSMKSSRSYVQDYEPKRAYQKPVEEYNSFKAQDYDEKPSYKQEHAKYEEKLPSKKYDYEFEQPYSQPRREENYDNYNKYERAHSRGNVSGKDHH